MPPQEENPYVTDRWFAAPMSHSQWPIGGGKVWREKLNRAITECEANEKLNKNNIKNSLCTDMDKWGLPWIIVLDEASFNIKFGKPKTQRFMSVPLICIGMRLWCYCAVKTYAQSLHVEDLSQD